jgi:hypothetical protein
MSERLGLQRAAALASRLLSAWPDSGASPQTAAIFADRMQSWELLPAQRAVERLIDSQRRFPSVAELREAYAAEGGSGADPGRNMSPAVRPLPPEPGAGERLEIERLQAELRARIALRAAEDQERYGAGQDDAEPAGGER